MTRRVLVDAELLEKVLPAKWPGAEVCRICGVRLSPGEKHLSSCPVPALQAALAQPGANVVEFDKYQPSAGEVLRLLADWREAAERRKDLKQRGKVDLALTSLVNELELRVTDLDPAHLRALTIPDNALSGMPAIPDKPTPEQEALVTERDAYRNLVAVLHGEATRDLAQKWPTGQRFSEHVLRRIDSQLMREGLPPLAAPADAGGEA